MENHEVQPYDVSCIDVKFPVCDHQLEIQGEEQVHGTGSQIKLHKMFMIADARSLHPSSIAGSLLCSPG